MATFSLRDVHKRYGTSLALDGVTCELPQGGCTGWSVPTVQGRQRCCVPWPDRFPSKAKSCWEVSRSGGQPTRPRPHHPRRSGRPLPRSDESQDPARPCRSTVRHLGQCLCTPPAAHLPT